MNTDDSSRVTKSTLSKNFPETLLHLFCQFEKVSSLWDDLCFSINSIYEESFNFSVFEKNVWCEWYFRTW